MKKLKYLFALGLGLCLSSGLQAQSQQYEAPDTENLSVPIKDPEDLDSPPPPGLLGGGETKIEEVSIYPNPGDGLLKIKLGAQEPGTAILIYDLTGRVYFDSELDPLAKREIEVDLRPMPDGVYVVRVGNRVKKYRKI